MRHIHLKQKWSYVIAIVFFLLSAASVYYIRQESPSTKPRADLIDCPGCNLVVILVDTLRADHLPFYGYQYDTAPFLDSLAEKSFVFERAYSASSWTAPATASVFTSVLPSSHGVVTGFAATRVQQRKDTSIKLNAIPEELETMGEFAYQAGFTTIGVTDNLNIGNEMGFDRGFSYFKKFKYKTAKAVNEKADEFLSQIPPGTPYFLYLHYMDPHEPYNKRNPWFKECMARSISNRNRDTKMLCAYDSEINFVDRHIGQLFSKYGWLENSVVIFLSDHGEEFSEHGKHGHGQSLYTEVIHVPFMIYHPAWPGRRVIRNVHTYDTLPTIAGLTGNPASSHWEGRNLISVMHKQVPIDARPIISERLRGKSSRFKWSKRSIVQDDLHFIRTDEEIKAQMQELYNLTSDPKELNNLATKEGQNTDKMAALLERHSQEIPEQFHQEKVEIEADPELLEELKTLGYLD